MNSDKTIMGIENFDVVAVLGVLIFFGLMEVISGYLHRTERKTSDWIQEAGGFLMLALGIKPLVVIAVVSIGSLAGIGQPFAEWNFWVLLAFYILIDDVLQYWYHRSAHEYEFLWKLHRPHHQAEEMGFFISYRNAGLYYVIMPNIWWVAFVTLMGGGKAVALGLFLKQLVIIGSHSTLHWDQIFYKNKFLKPIVQVLERIIITPAFHHGHHGKSMADGISDPNGNFGNMFSIWDQIFGTAKFTHQFPTELGLINDPKEEWTAAYFYPFVKSANTESEIGKGYKKESTISLEPSQVHLEKGNHLWCQCGFSKNQPFCDGSHHGTKIKPKLFEVKREGNYRLCNCKATKSGPFCDDSHLEMKE